MQEFEIPLPVSSSTCELISIFSDDICYEILSYLDHNHDAKFILLNCALISKQWLMIVQKFGKISIQVGNKIVDSVADSSKKCQLLECFVKFEIYSNQFSKFKETIGMMKNLKSLCIRNDPIRESLIWLFQLDQLTELDLIHSLVDDNEITPITKMPQLTRLNLSKNNLTKHLSNITIMKQLKYLNISECNLEYSTSFKYITQLENLTFLDVSSNPIRNEDTRLISERLKQLTSLNISNTLITDIKLLSKMSQLTEIDISGNDIRVGDELVGKEQLKTLKMISVKRRGWIPINQLGKIFQLTCLDISNNRFGDDVMSLNTLAQLTQLNVQYNEIGYRGARALSVLPELTKLNISFNKIGDEGVRLLKQATKLTELDVSSNRISDVGASLISEIPQLTNLTINSNEIGNVGAKSISQMSKLKYLSINGNQISDEGAKSLLEMKQMRKIELYGNGISNDIFQSFGLLIQNKLK